MFMCQCPGLMMKYLFGEYIYYIYIYIYMNHLFVWSWIFLGQKYSALILLLGLATLIVSTQRPKYTINASASTCTPYWLLAYCWPLHMTCYAFHKQVSSHLDISSVLFWPRLVADGFSFLVEPISETKPVCHSLNCKLQLSIREGHGSYACIPRYRAVAKPVVW